VTTTEQTQHDLCVWCGLPFVAVHRRHRWCSPQCRYASHDYARPGTHRGTSLTADCVDCGTTFTYSSTTKPRLRCDECRLHPRPRSITNSRKESDV
jgi:hypothetical protein